MFGKKRDRITKIVAIIIGTVVIVSMVVSSFALVLY